MRNYGIWGCIPTVFLANSHYMIDMSSEAGAFLIGLGTGSLIGQCVAFYMTVTEKPSMKIY